MFFTVSMWVFPKIMVPQIIHFNRVFHYKPSILGYPYFLETSMFFPSIQQSNPSLYQGNSGFRSCGKGMNIEQISENSFRDPWTRTYPTHIAKSNSSVLIQMGWFDVFRNNSHLLKAIGSTFGPVYHAWIFNVGCIHLHSLPQLHKCRYVDHTLTVRDILFLYNE